MKNKFIASTIAAITLTISVEKAEAEAEVSPFDWICRSTGLAFVFTNDAAFSFFGGWAYECDLEFSNSSSIYTCAREANGIQTLSLTIQHEETASEPKAGPATITAATIVNGKPVDGWTEEYSCTPLSDLPLFN